MILIVFVDDFSGTGDQACSAWKDTLAELLPEEPNVYLVLIAANGAAAERIKAETDLTVVPYITLGSDDNIFSAKCSHFSDAEKAKSTRILQ